MKDYPGMINKICNYSTYYWHWGRSGRKYKNNFSQKELNSSLDNACNSCSENQDPTP
jgi:hypothetical protein